MSLLRHSKGLFSDGKKAESNRPLSHSQTKLCFLAKPAPQTGGAMWVQTRTDALPSRDKHFGLSRSSHNMFMF